MSLLVIATVLTKALEVAGVLITSSAIGSASAITAGVLENRSIETITAWGLYGTAAGFVLGVPLAICAAVLA
jgi:hypothetical protein